MQVVGKNIEGYYSNWDFKVNDSIRGDDVFSTIINVLVNH